MARRAGKRATGHACKGCACLGAQVIHVNGHAGACDAHTLRATGCTGCTGLSSKGKRSWAGAQEMCAGESSPAHVIALHSQKDRRAGCHVNVRQGGPKLRRSPGDAPASALSELQGAHGWVRREARQGMPWTMLPQETPAGAAGWQHNQEMRALAYGRCYSHAVAAGAQLQPRRRCRHTVATASAPLSPQHGAPPCLRLLAHTRPRPPLTLVHCLPAP